MANISFPIPMETENQLRDMLATMAREVIQGIKENELHSKDFMNLTETSKYLDVSFNTLKKYINEEDLPYIKLDGKTFISKQSLKAWMHQHEQ